LAKFGNKFLKFKSINFIPETTGVKFPCMWGGRVGEGDAPDVPSWHTRMTLWVDRSPQMLLAGLRESF